jgi:hypothetical protein
MVRVTSVWKKLDIASTPQGSPYLLVFARINRDMQLITYVIEQ